MVVREIWYFSSLPLSLPSNLLYPSFNIFHLTINQTAGWAAVAMVWLFVVHFGYSWGPCAWIIVAEIWPLSNRPYGIALGASSNWMNNFIVGQVTPDMISGITYGTYLIFGILTFMGAAFVWFFVPETKRLTLEEMVCSPMSINSIISFS